MKVLGKFEVAMGSMNANKEITKVIVDGVEIKGSEIPEELRKWFKEQPRVSCRSNGSPKIKFDGAEVQLGYWACNQSELDKYKASRSGGSTKTTSSEKQECREELIKFSETLNKKDSEALMAIVDRLFPDEKTQKLQKMVNGLDEASLELLKSLLSK